MHFTDRVVTLESTTSTMHEARERATAAAPHGTTVVAREQSQGRGRLGRAWLSRRDAGVFMTTILRPRLDDPARAGELAIVAGVAVLRAVQALGASGARLKWPNDVLVEGRKLAGVLLEADRLTTDPVVLVGIGMNVAPASAVSLPDELRGLYTGLAEHAPVGAHALPRVRDEVLAALEACYDRWAREGLRALVPEWNANDALRGRPVRIDGPETVTGVADGVNESGELRVLTESGVKLVRSGEVIA